MTHQEKNLESFAKKYEELERQMCVMEADKEDMDRWFGPALRVLTSRYDESIVSQYAQENHTVDTFHIGYLVRAGVKAFDEDFLLTLTQKSDELEVYEAALALVICGHAEGFRILRAFILQFHLLYTAWISPVDMMEDLEYIVNDEKATWLAGEIRMRYPFVFSEEKEPDESENLFLLKEKLGATNRPNTDFEIRLAKYVFFWLVKPKSYEDYGTGLGGWLINRATREIIAVAAQVDPDICSEILRETQDPNYGATIRLDSTDKKSLIKLKNLLQVPLSEAKSIADRQHWFGGHTIQLTYIKEKLKAEGVETLLGFIRFDGSIKRLSTTPHEGYFREDIIKFVKSGSSHFWQE